MSDWGETRRMRMRMHVGCFEDGGLATLADYLDDGGRPVTLFDELTREKRIEIVMSRLGNLDAEAKTKFRITVPGLGVVDGARARRALESLGMDSKPEDDYRIGNLLIRLEGNIIQSVLSAMRRNG